MSWAMSHSKKSTIYDNDPLVLQRERERLQQLIKTVDNALEIIAMENNEEEWFSIDGTAKQIHDEEGEEEEEEVERHNYFVLNKVSLGHESRLHELIAKEPQRFSLIKRNHVFAVNHGSMAQYDARDMTLAIQRIAFIKEKRNKRSGPLYRFGQLFLGGFLVYLVWMLWTIMTLSIR